MCTHIKQQIELSKLSGETDKVNQSVSQSGVHDTTSATIVNSILVLGKTFQKRTVGKPSTMPKAQVTACLEHKLESLLGSQSIDDLINPLLRMQGLGVHKYMPTEILHTILCSVVKYFWGQTAYILDKAQLIGKFQSQLDSIEKNGLNSLTLTADYIVRYKRGLVGKHFKTLA